MWYIVETMTTFCWNVNCSDCDKIHPFIRTGFGIFALVICFCVDSVNASIVYFVV